MNKIHIFGIPSSAGALFKGTEWSPYAIREAGLMDRLVEAGWKVEDFGNIVSSDEMLRHNVGPVRNWPSPRMIWEATVNQTETLFSNDAFTMILGGDCSIEVGTFTAFKKTYGENSHLLVVDGHVDTVHPRGDACIGAAGMGLWFLTQDKKVWWTEEPTPPQSISIIGPHTLSENDCGINILPLAELKHEGIVGKIKSHLASIPSDNKILVHLDVDVLHESIMPSAYSPSQTGLNRNEALELFNNIFSDPRVKGIEVTEFSAQKDDNGESAKMIVDLLSLVKMNQA
ncbi:MULTISPECIES: arginase family protein [unclassified Bacillus (in: firmicutes)]|uniref:arginase family protein n=1 Tax=unclassified Bacillus (in: firmicutes) TaxID=185979 RepID=UPI0008E4B27F|nr:MULTISPECIES: arginase family protein [unclassified Bacillus (in: firmicutes)]SFA88759.1 Arginase family enzyme [Bacillus sp. UNCCL13]SFQ84688.1 Arginase family enzyme [Bacillus sp. cl95]